MIWDFIRDFFVQYVFGGYTSGGDYFSGLWGINNPNGLPLDGVDNALCYQVGIDTEGLPVIFEASDWLSTTATIIVMCLIVFLLICLVRWIFRTVSSAMLLK